ncbi:MAG: glycoside hydrolase family 3 C-terminal domain-containing protein [Bacteroidaceae bacterium]|nr:glycoside hydrolase family 3 C-terminal domain-containing protein [Bacteroidaceae bacterium]
MRKAFLFAAFICSLTSQAQIKAPQTKGTPAQRAEQMLKQMTLEEKLGLMENSSKPIERLGIKPYNWWNETLHGVGRNGLATVFPQCVGLASTFDNDLVYNVFYAASDEARAKYFKARQEGNYAIYTGLTFWTPNVNIFRDPRWGRGQETYGEDPYLTSVMGLAVVNGLQGNFANLGVDKLHACAKHFAVHSGPEWNRHTYDVETIDPRDLWETYMPAFKTLVQKGNVKEVMCAYNRLDGDPCCGSSKLLNQILRNEWGFTGVVTSDCGAVTDFYLKGHHETHPDESTASAAALLSGTDVECGSIYAKGLKKAIEDGIMDEETVNTSVRRLLTARFELGEMDDVTPWDSIPYSVVSSKEHQALNLKAALESIVLLQNKNNILPLSSKMKVALIGPNAADSVMMWGNYNGTPDHTYTILEGVKKYAKKLIYDPACNLVSDQLFTSLFGQLKSKSGKGLAATYWNNNKMEGPSVIQTQMTAPFSLTTEGNTHFAQNVNLENFSASYKGTFTPTKNGSVEFLSKYIGQVELLVNGESVAKVTGYAPAEKSLYKLNATAGKNYEIEVRYAWTGYQGLFSFNIGTYSTIQYQNVVNKVKGADVVIFAGGISPQLEGEEMPVQVEGFKGGDRTDIQLPKVQRELLKALKKAGKKVIFVNCSGSAIGLDPETENCDAIIQLFYPGQQGGKALAQVLYGEYNPAGRLPLTFYKDTLQIPDFEDYSMKGRTYRYMKEDPTFSFGYGLSYTTFNYGEAKVLKDKIIIPVTNAGSKKGEEVVQLYVNRPADKEGPIKALRGFKRVEIAAGETVNVELPLNDETFTWWDTFTNTMIPQSGDYKLMYGGSSRNQDLKTVSITRP